MAAAQTEGARLSGTPTTKNTPEPAATGIEGLTSGTPLTKENHR